MRLQDLEAEDVDAGFQFGSGDVNGAGGGGTAADGEIGTNEIGVALGWRERFQGYAVEVNRCGVVGHDLYRSAGGRAVQSEGIGEYHVGSVRGREIARVGRISRLGIGNPVRTVERRGPERIRVKILGCFRTVVGGFGGAAIEGERHRRSKAGAGEGGKRAKEKRLPSESCCLHGT